MKHDMQDAAYIEALQSAGHPCQSSIFPTPHERRSLDDGVAIVLSDFFWHQTVGRESVASVEESLSLKAGEHWKSPAMKVGDFAALTVHLSYTGTLELRVKDHIHRDGKPADWKPEDRIYTLNSMTPKETAVGLRLYKISPEIEIVALEDADIKVVANIYEL